MVENLIKSFILKVCLPILSIMSWIILKKQSWIKVNWVEEDG